MLKELKFVQGAVAKKDFVPVMTHFSIEKGQVRSYNGVIALSSPIPLDISCKPKAGPLVKALSNCNESVSLTMTDASQLKIQSGKFKVFVECINDDIPLALPEGKDIPVDGETLLAALKMVSEFIGDDASRPWTNGVLFRGQSAFATNNVCLIEYWLGFSFPHPVNLPQQAIKEVLRINEAPSLVQLAPSSITFHYSDGRWIRSQLFSPEWPDLSKLLDKPSNPVKLDPLIFEGLDHIKGFVDKLGSVHFIDGSLSTHPDLLNGASFEIPGLPSGLLFNIEMLKLLNGVADTIDLSDSSKPCLFYGKRLRGAIIGMRRL